MKSAIKRSTAFAILTGVAITALGINMGRSAEYVISAIFLIFMSLNVTQTSHYKISLIASLLISWQLIMSISNYLLNENFSSWQFFRASIWAVISIYMIEFGYYAARSKRNPASTIVNVVKNITMIVMISTLIDVITGIPIGPISIRTDGNTFPRVFIIFSILLCPLLYWCLKTQDIFATSLIFIGIALTQSKAILAAAMIILLFSGTNRKFKFIVFTISIFILANAVDWTRLNALFEHGDAVRLQQAMDALQITKSSEIRFLLGSGPAIPYSDGFLIYGNNDGWNENLFENSRFDIENMYSYLLLRYGLLGMLGILYLLWRYQTKGRDVSIFLSTLTLGASGSLFPGPAAVVYFFICSMIISIKQPTR